MIFLAGKIKEIVENIILERSKGNPAIAEMTKAKFILKGINPDKYDKDSYDDPDIIDKLLAISKQLNEADTGADPCHLRTILSTRAKEETVVEDIKNQLNWFDAKLIVFFASSSFNLVRLNELLQSAFKDSIVFGCSTAGEIKDGILLKNSVVAMAFDSNLVADAKVEVIEALQTQMNVEDVFCSFERHFHQSCYTMDAAKYLGMVLIDGVSMKEEKLMDLIGNRSNVYFIGGSAGDDLSYRKTYVCANGKTFSDAAVLALVKINDCATFDIIRTQSYKVLEPRLVATKVNEETREVVEFNHKPAIEAYAEAIGNVDIEEASSYFSTHPVGLVVGEKDIFVRSPREKIGTSIKFYCNLLEGMEVRLLESTNIIDDTKAVIDDKIKKFGQIDGMINFQCIERTLELEKRNQVQEYGKLFHGIPNVGFSTYGEEYIGHINQTSTMLVFKSETMDTSAQRLKETISAMKEFNIMLEEEINERSKREEEIRYLSYHDKLTGLYNRRFYEEEIKRLNNIKTSLPISIILGDVDGLKLVNDLFGHQKGDELLKKAADGIQLACRSTDIAARWGGDEFVILLPETRNEEAKAIVDRIKAFYENERLDELKVSISFGWDTKDHLEEDILDVLKSAEDRMYENKLIEKQVLKGQAIEKICIALYEKNQKIEEHAQKVGDICQQIGTILGLPEIESSYLKAAGLLHDMGKIVIEEQILNKAGKLSTHEWDEIKRHPELGYRMLSSSYNLVELAEGVLSHHERWDGRGYPRGLKGEEIPMVARILAIADSYAAMTSERVYGQTLSKEEAINEIRKNMATQFDPQIAKIFIDHIVAEN